MIKLIFVLLSLLIFNNCIGQKKTIKKITPKRHYKMEIPNITKENIKLSNLEDLISNENSKILQKTHDSSKVINDRTKELNFEQNGFASLYKDGKVKLLSKITEDKAQKPIPRKKEHFNSPKEFTQKVQTLVDFYSNGSVHTIKQYNNNSNGYYPAGNWYAYDESGNLLQHIDHEKHFKMSYYDVAQIADSYDYSAIRISRIFDLNKSYWIIQMNGVQDEPIEPKTIILDDKTGKVLYDMNQEESNNFRGLDDMAKYSEDLYRSFKPN